LDEVIYEEKVTVKFETMLLMKELNGIILGDMTTPTVYLNPW
jgi:hypothetical protein